MLIDTGNKYCLDKYDAVYFCDHTFSQFDNSFYFVIKKPKETIIRLHYKENLFVCKDCHLDVVKTFNSYWLFLGDFSNYFMRCFFFKKKKRFKSN